MFKTSWFKYLIVAVLSLVLFACESSSVDPKTNPENEKLVFRNVDLVVPYDQNLEINSYFSPFDRLDLVVLKVLETAQSEVILAQYNIRNEAILNKLVELANKGVSVRVVVDYANSQKDYNIGDDFLEENGIEVLRMRPSRNSLMHLKSSIIDNKIVMTGSFNWSSTAVFANNENMIVINNENVAKKYRKEVIDLLNFERVVEGGEIDDVFEVHYSPEEKLYKEIISEIKKAKKSIDVAMFTFTRMDIARALKEATTKGVKVRVIMEKKQFRYSRVDDFFLEEEEITELSKEYPEVLFVQAANKVTKYSAMHNKYAIFDQKTVLTGASNWTSNGTVNSEEDILIIKDEELAYKYTQNFNDLLNIYAGINENFTSEIVRLKTPIMFHIINENTEYGDRVFITGGTEELGNWNPSMGIEAFTSGTMFPNWSTSAYLPTGQNIEYKIVVIGADNSVKWESGSNRVVEVPHTGRAMMIKNTYDEQ